jgi:hypothetical protein
MSILQIEHAVRDYDAWKKAFDSDPVGREQGGVRRYRVSRPTDDPNYIVVDLEFETSEEAEAFHGALRELWGRVEGELGLETPGARILQIAEAKHY